MTPALQLPLHPSNVNSGLLWPLLLDATVAATSTTQAFFSDKMRTLMPALALGARPGVRRAVGVCNDGLDAGTV
jgi:hypothetical protein